MAASEAPLGNGLSVRETPPMDDVADRACGHVQKPSGTVLGKVGKPNQPKGVAGFLKSADLETTVTRADVHGFDAPNATKREHPSLNSSRRRAIL